MTATLASKRLMAGEIADESPFHGGEQQVQERLGVRDIEEWARQVVRPYLPEQHRAFYSSLPFLVIAARDQRGRPWTTFLVGHDAFVASPDPNTLTIAAMPTPGDALEGALAPGVDVGFLGIELAARRRNRVNGRVEAVSADSFELLVSQSFGNCPQYIREREWRRVDEPPTSEPVASGGLLPPQQAWIASADTFFIGSGYRGDGDSATYGMDASHRGGDAGFVRVVDERHIVFPDYAGNNHFNTIGNLVVDSRAGISFVDFETGSVLQLSGRASIDWDSTAVAQTSGARRLVEFEIDAVVELPGSLPLRWLQTAESVRSLRLVEKTRESDDVTSFVFEARDGGPLASFKAGQHLPIELEIPALEEPLARTYSLSAAPGAERYRISVKREPHGTASRQLHDRVQVGAILDARVPAGDFILPCSLCPVVLVSAGVGVTPMVSMLHALASEGGERPVWFVHGARDGAHHPLADEIRELASRRPGIQIHVAFSQPQPQDTLGADYESAGRITGDLLASLVRRDAAQYLLCGPTTFMAAIASDLERRGVRPDRIHSETFGPAS